MKMKYIIFAGAVVVFSSCSTAYRAGQTPDDVYYSPAPVQSSYVSSVNDNDRNSYYYRNNVDDQNTSGNQDQNYLSLAPVTLDLGFGYSPYGYGGLGYNPFYYNSFGNPFYSYDPYGMYNPYMYNSFGYSGLGFYNPYNFYNSYGYYNPYSLYNSSFLGHYYPSQYYPGSGNSNISLYSGPRAYNLNAYTNTGSINRSNQGVGVRGSNPENTSPAPIRRSSGIGNVIRRVFTPNRNTYVSPNSNRSYNNSNNYRGNNNSETYRTFNNEQAPSRNYNSSPSVNTPSNSGSSNGSAPVRTFRR